MANENANANASKKANETAPVANQEQRDLRTELSGTSEGGEGFQVPRVEDTKITKPFTTPPDQNTVNPIANLDSVDPATGYDPALPIEETGVRAEREEQEEDDWVDVGDKAQFLKNLYNNAQVRGWGAFSATTDWTDEEAELYVARLQAAPGKAGFGLMSSMFVGDIFGRRIRVDLAGDRANLRQYNAANGKAARNKVVK